MTAESREEGAPRQAPHPAARPRRAYETPRLILYGRVKDLTAGLKNGTKDLGLGGDIILTNLT
jgi:hypothetical protein